MGMAIRGEEAAFDEPVERALRELFEHLNDGHGDTLLLVASRIGGEPDLVEAELVGADRAGVRVRARRADGSVRPLHLPFDGRPDSLLTVRAELFAMIGKARAAAGPATALTSLERELAQAASLRTFLTAVDRVVDLGPKLRQITVRGGLEEFNSLGADQFLYTMVPRPGGDPAVIAPGFRMEDLGRIPEHDRPLAAYYTVRRFDPLQRTLDLWFVLHDHDGGVAGWARRARIGDRLALWGPRTAFTPPDSTRSFLLVGDETGLPAIAAILEELGPEAQAHVVIETADAANLVELPRSRGVSLHWLFRGDAEPGTGERLPEAVRGLALDRDGLYAFGAAEASQIGAIRRHLRRERELAAPQVRMVAYWRREEAGTASEA